MGDLPIDTALYTDGAGKLAIDKLYKYEEITEGLADIAAKTGIENRPLKN
jgi:hypothetical protein